MDPQNREPLTEELKDKKEENTGKTDQTEPKMVPVYSEKAETRLPEADPDELKALALSYARYLAEQGLKITDRNFRCRTGEIDLVARDGEYVVFVEVKYRKDCKEGHPLEAVTAAKQRRIRQAALYFLMERNLSPDLITCPSQLR